MFASTGKITLLSTLYLLSGFVIYNFSCTPPRQDLKLATTQWILTSFTDATTEVMADQGREAYLIFDTTSFVGHTGCNQVGGSYTVSDMVLNSSDGYATKMYCESTATQERVFLAVLNDNPTVRLEKSDLTLIGKEGRKLIFAAAQKDMSDTTNAATAKQPIEQAKADDKALVTQTRDATTPPPTDGRLRGMFSWRAGVASFVHCQSGEKYAVASDQQFLSLQSAYRRAVREDEGREVFVVIKGKLQAPANDQQEKKELIVEETISVSRTGDCTTPVKDLVGHYRYMADAAIFVTCTGQRYPVALDAAQPYMEKAYIAAGVDPPEPALVSVSGFITDALSMEGTKKEPTLFIIDLRWMQRDADCP